MEEPTNVSEAEATKRATLELWGTDPQSSVHWYPPVLRRAVDAALELRVEVFD